MAETHVQMRLLAEKERDIERELRIKAEKKGEIKGEINSLKAILNNDSLPGNFVKSINEKLMVLYKKLENLKTNEWSKLEKNFLLISRNPVRTFEKWGELYRPTLVFPIILSASLCLYLSIHTKFEKPKLGDN